MTVANRVIPVRQRRSWRWVLLVLAAVCAVAAIGTYLTAPRPGGRMDPASTGPDGAHALVTLLRDRGVTVVVATSVAEAESAAGSGTLLLFAQTQRSPTIHCFTGWPPRRAICCWLSRPRTPAPPSPQVSAAAAPACATPSRIVRCAKRTGLDRWISGPPTPTALSVTGRSPAATAERWCATATANAP